LHFLGEISYSIYLAHIFVVTGCVYLLIQSEGYLNIAPGLRFLIALTATAPFVFGTSYILYRCVELRGISFGRKFVKRIS
jgi:peptidoglycan/LPS O-acetylase OafA/YrhL